MTAATADLQMDKTQAEERKVALPLRDDTFLGVCEAIGSEFGFNPNWLRVAFGLVILMNPMVAVGAYLALGIFVAVAYWLFPASTKQAAAQAADVQAADDNDESEDRMAA
jgi:phage shock protein PspC (stress-responsive transcriptional regulator)